MKNNKLLACPYIVWMILFTIIPLGIVFYYALTDSMTGQFTLANLASIGTYLPIFLRSIWLSLFASLICLVIGYPVAYFIAQCKPLTQRFLEMLIMLPMCMSFLLRTLAWVAMLEDTGILNNLFRVFNRYIYVFCIFIFYIIIFCIFIIDVPDLRKTIRLIQINDIKIVFHSFFPFLSSRCPPPDYKKTT